MYYQIEWVVEDVDCQIEVCQYDDGCDVVVSVEGKDLVCDVQIKVCVYFQIKEVGFWDCFICDGFVQNVWIVDFWLQISFIVGDGCQN